MIRRFGPQLVRCICVIALSGILGGLVLTSSRVAGEPKSARPVWQYRELEVMPNAIQATLDDLGRDGWEVFDVYGAPSVTNEGDVAKLVPHTFYVFAKRPQ